MPDNDKTQDQILSAAAEVIIRLGYNKTNMSDIAEEAGLSRRTIYLYFQGKEELFEALLIPGMAALRPNLAGICGVGPARRHDGRVLPRDAARRKQPSRSSLP